jgi:hypothetical protein
MNGRPLKKLFARQDAKQYLANLERLVVEHGLVASLSELQSEGRYKSVEMVA